MMAAPHEAVFILAHAHERQPHQRGLPEIELLSPVARQVLCQPDPLLLLFKPSPVALVNSQPHAAPHNLQRLFHSFPFKTCTQHRVMIDDRLPCRAEGSAI